MNPTAIYSKSGKGVQEASGKTSLLKRADRAVLSAIDGRANLGEVAEKVGKPFDAAFQQLIAQLDRDGFVREVSSGSASARPAPAAAAASSVADLDFTSLMPSAPPANSAKAREEAERRAKEQEAALYRARQEAEAKAQAERDRVRAEAEARARAEHEAKTRAELERKAKADAEFSARMEAEAKARAAAQEKAKAEREAALREAAARAEAEAKRAREEAERARREAEERAERARREADERAERARKEAEEKARREAEELRQRLEQERRAREEAERRAKEEAERARQEAERVRLEAERLRLEAERQAKEEAERLRREAEQQAKEEAERLRREAEEAMRREAEEMRRQLEEERRKLAEEREQREEEERRRRQEAELREARERAEEELRREAREREEAEEAAREAERAVREETERAKAEEKARAAAAAAPKASPSADEKFANSLLAELESFSQRQEEEEARRTLDEEEAGRRRLAEEQARLAQEEAARLAQEEEERAREEAEQRRREKEARRRDEEEARRRAEDEEKRIAWEEQRRRLEEEQRQRKAKEEEVRAAQATRGTNERYSPAPVSERLRREAQLQAHRRPGEARARKKGWGKPVALTLFLLLVLAVGALHVLPVPTAEYERMAGEALGRPVKIASARFWLFSSPHIRFEGVSVDGAAKIDAVNAYPELDSLFGERKTFRRMELEGLSVAQEALGQVVFPAAHAPAFGVRSIVLRDLKLPGALPLPPLGGDALLDAEGAIVQAVLHGPDNLVARLSRKGGELTFDVSAARFTLPVAQAITLGQFGMKGTANRRGLSIASWDGTLYDGRLAGTATLRWGGPWTLEGALTARGLNAAVFAPALLSEGRGEGSALFSMSGADPARLAAAGRLEGTFTVHKGTLGSFDLSRAVQSGGRQPQGRTAFAEMQGQAIYDRGAVSLRNVNIAAGALNAGGIADIAPNGALSGRIVADVKTAAQTLRATLNLGGTVREPQVRN